MRKLQLIAALACMGWTVKAQDTLKIVRLDEVVVTGTKSEIPVEKSGKSIFKLSREDIEESGSTSVADLLNEVPGVQMDGNFGPLGTNISYFVRGASSKSTLILIDGVPFNDPSGVNQTYDLRLLDLSQVESIEILKGGLSSLYGTGAAAGVINIILKKSSKSGIGGSVGVEYGSFNTINPKLNISGGFKKLSFGVNAGYKKSDGFSAALDESGNGNYDDDGFEGYNFLGKLGYDFTESFSLGFTGALDDFEIEYDGGAFSDGDNTADSQQLRIGLSPKLKWGGGSLRGDFFLAKLDKSFSSLTEGKNIQADLIVDQNLNENLKLIGGMNYQKMAYSQPTLVEESFTMFDNYASLIFDYNSVNMQIGGRINQHSNYGSNFVWNVNPSYLIAPGNGLNIKIFSSYSTSFIAPSLFQLFGPFGSNVDLQPEESKSAEGGILFNTTDIQFEAVYFRRKDENRIIYSSKYENADQKIETEGIELNGELDLSAKVRLSGNYTYVRSLDEAIIYRVPEHKYGLSLYYRPMSSVLLKTSYLHTGDRDQPFYNSSTFTSEVVETASFDLIDFFVSYQLQNLTLSGAINNVFAEDYIGQYGYTTIGRNYTIGLRYNFN